MFGTQKAKRMNTDKQKMENTQLFLPLSGITTCKKKAQKTKKQAELSVFSFCPNGQKWKKAAFM